MDYVRATDPYPLQAAASTRLAPFYRSLARGKLTTTVCSQCERRHWPPRVVCPRCLSDQLDWVELPPVGRIHAFTTQDTGVPPGFPRPLVLAVVMIGELRIFTRLVGADPATVRRGRTVRLAPCQVAVDPQTGEKRYLPSFALVDES